MVRRDAYFDDDDHLTLEYGVIVECWFAVEIDGYDCRIAFFGTELPEGKVEEAPYVLRYASVGLNVLEKGNPHWTNLLKQHGIEIVI